MQVLATPRLFPASNRADTVRMPPSTTVFERASEHIVISRHQYSGCVQLLVIGRDGVTRSRSFASLEEALAHQQLLESALVAAGWVLEEVLSPDSSAVM
jgi:hypothetical protein